MAEPKYIKDIYSIILFYNVTVDRRGALVMLQLPYPFFFSSTKGLNLLRGLGRGSANCYGYLMQLLSLITVQACGTALREGGLWTFAIFFVT